MKIHEDLGTGDNLLCTIIDLIHDRDSFSKSVDFVVEEKSNNIETVANRSCFPLALSLEGIVVNSFIENG